MRHGLKSLLPILVLSTGLLLNITVENQYFPFHTASAVTSLDDSGSKSNVTRPGQETPPKPNIETPQSNKETPKTDTDTSTSSSPSAADQIETLDVTALPGPAAGSGDTGISLGEVFNAIIRFLAGIVGAVVLLQIIRGGLAYIQGTGKGFEERNVLIRNSLVGLVIVMLSGMIASGFLSLFYGATPGQTQNTSQSVSLLPRDGGPGTSATTCGETWAQAENASRKANQPKIGTKDVDGVTVLDFACVDLNKMKKRNPDCFYDRDFRERYIGTLNNCGAQTLDDVTLYARSVIRFLYNIIGTLMVIALMIAGYTYIFSMDKAGGEGVKRFQAVFTGALIAMLAAPALQLALSFIDSIM